MSMPQERKVCDSVRVEKRGPSIVIKFPPAWTLAPAVAAGIEDLLRKGRAERIGHADVGYEPGLEEGRAAFALGEIEQAIGDDDIARGESLSQGATGTNGHDAFDSQGFQGEDIGPVIDLAGGDGVPGIAVTGQEGNHLAF